MALAGSPSFIATISIMFNAVSWRVPEYFCRDNRDDDRGGGQPLSSSTSNRIAGRISDPPAAPNYGAI